MEKVIDEGAKAFDSERFDTPFPEYIDELILGHDSAGKLTSATAMTSKDNAIDCAITVHDYYGSLYVANGKTSSSIGEWLGVTSTDRFSEWRLNLVDTRASVPQITNWSSSRSQVNGGFEATVYYGSSNLKSTLLIWGLFRCIIMVGLDLRATGQEPKGVWTNEATSKSYVR